MGEARLRVIRLAALAAGAVFAWLEWQASPNAERLVLALDIAAGLSFIAAGVIIVRVPTARRIAFLELGAGFAWFAGALTPLASGLYLGFLVHLLATYPIGRIERPVERLVVVAGYAAAFLVPHLGLTGIDAALLGVVAALAQIRASAAGGPLRRGRTAAAVAAATLALTFVLVAAGLATETIDVAGARIASAIVLILTTTALAIDLRWGGWSHDALARLVIDLGDRAQATTLRDRLAEALDDPTLVIGYRLDDGLAYVDDDGRPVELPAPGSARVAVPLTVPVSKSASWFATSGGRSIRSSPMAWPRRPNSRSGMPGSTPPPVARLQTWRPLAPDSSPLPRPSAVGSAASSKRRAATTRGRAQQPGSDRGVGARSRGTPGTSRIGDATTGGTIERARSSQRPGGWARTGTEPARRAVTGRRRRRCPGRALAAPRRGDRVLRLFGGFGERLQACACHAGLGDRPRGGRVAGCGGRG